MNLIDIIDQYGIDTTNIAHIYRDSFLTYKDLKEKSDALACFLIEKYKDDKTPIVVLGHKQHLMLVCFLACVKSGHSYIPIDSSLPVERIKDIINDSKSKLIFSVENLSTAFNDIEILNEENINNYISKYNYKKPSKDYMVQKDDVYYIIYTSGSTGKPKGVQITLGNLESFVKWSKDLCSLNNKAIFMNQAPFSFDLSVMDLYTSLYTGSALFSIDKMMIKNFRELFSYLKKSNINIWVSTPSFAEMCLADTSFNKELIPGLSLMLFCGETLTNSCVEKLSERFPDIKIINTYGPTECTVAVTAIEVTRELNNTVSPLPVGKVKGDCEILIVDEEKNAVQNEGKGEIVIVGESVSPGYYNNKMMTDKSFFKVNVNGEMKRAYRTGDAGYLKNGMLYYCGRIDFQVKLNGYRIEIEDIENNLRKIDFINNGVVIPVFKENKIQYLAAAVTLNKKTEEKNLAFIMKIKKELGEYIPEYMIPRKIVIKDSLPTTSNGKINRRLLTEMFK